MSFDENSEWSYGSDESSSGELSVISWSTGTSNTGEGIPTAISKVNIGYNKNEESTPVPPRAKALKKVSFGQDFIEEDAKKLRGRYGSDESL